ncbi:MAG: hypothetical protein HYX37_19680 [Rhizobiales bacterium]|nr:hypothetical protein [Hyphomicrobiales bacterium]
MPSIDHWFSGAALFLAGSFLFTIAVGIIGIREMISDKIFLVFLFAAVNLGLLAWYTAAKQERDTAELRINITKIAGAAGANPNQSVQTLADEIIKRIAPISEGLETTKKKVEAIINPPREPNGVYIYGALSGHAYGIRQTSAKTVIIKQIQSPERMFEGEIFEVGPYQFRFLKADSISVITMPGGIGGATHTNVTAEVVGEIPK